MNILKQVRLCLGGIPHIVDDIEIVTDVNNCTIMVFNPITKDIGKNGEKSCRRSSKN